MPAPVCSFNSIKVRLELAEMEAIRANIEFQLHKGTMRTGAWVVDSYQVSEFPFHKGTIRTNKYAPADKAFQVSIP